VPSETASRRHGQGGGVRGPRAPSAGDALYVSVSRFKGGGGAIGHVGHVLAFAKGRGPGGVPPQRAGRRGCSRQPGGVGPRGGPSRQGGERPSRRGVRHTSLSCAGSAHPAGLRASWARARGAGASRRPPLGEAVPSQGGGREALGRQRCRAGRGPAARCVSREGVGSGGCAAGAEAHKVESGCRHKRTAKAGGWAPGRAASGAGGAGDRGAAPSQAGGRATIAGKMIACRGRGRPGQGPRRRCSPSRQVSRASARGGGTALRRGTRACPRWSWQGE